MENRDFIGYGENPPNIVWPNKAKIAISVVVNYEEGSEYSLLDGDTHHETNNEVPSPVPLNNVICLTNHFLSMGAVLVFGGCLICLRDMV
ncbi:MAG: hypothetical protein CM1200mP15_12730 [Dehalococcoidia bacterium]|nr:MAG: hypothetical protein CM1200mP15_12730 [Dehalococcoidia bacterium]